MYFDTQFMTYFCLLLLGIYSRMELTGSTCQLFGNGLLFFKVIELINLCILRTHDPSF